MLTIQVDNAQLEARLAQQARETGKPAEQIAEELLANALEHLMPAELSFSKLDPQQHSHQLQFDVDPSDDTPAFQHVDDTIQFASALRRNAWKR